VPAARVCHQVILRQSSAPGRLSGSNAHNTWHHTTGEDHAWQRMHDPGASLVFTHSEHCWAGGVDRGTGLSHHHTSVPCSFPHGWELGDGSDRQSSLIGHVWPRLSHSSQQSKSRGWRASISFALDSRTFLLRRQDIPHRSTTKNRT